MINKKTTMLNEKYLGLNGTGIIDGKRVICLPVSELKIDFEQESVCIYCAFCDSYNCYYIPCNAKERRDKRSVYYVKLAEGHKQKLND